LPVASSAWGDEIQIQVIDAESKREVPKALVFVNSPDASKKALLSKECDENGRVSYLADERMDPVLFFSAHKSGKRASKIVKFDQLSRWPAKITLEIATPER
jgi:hypothetical protein